MANLSYPRLVGIIGLCLLLEMLSACSSFSARARHAAVAAAHDPWTWGPLAGAAVIAATNNDVRISQWAKSETPVFGSSEAALEASDRFRSYASSSAWAIFLAAPSHDKESWLPEKGPDASGKLLGLALARNTTGMLKQAGQRERPNDHPVHDSFPSAHASDAFAHAALARDYTAALPLYRPLRTGVQWASEGFAFATAWGRVEGGVHYPTDVLMGAVVANFTTRFFMKLIPRDPKSAWRVHTRTIENGELIIEFARPL